MQTSEDLQKRILLVEDESLIAADLALRIARLGYPAPVIAHSAEEALKCARSTRFDLVLMDVRLKGEMDGVAAAAALQSELRTPVVYVTAYADEETVERARFTEPLGYRHDALDQKGLLDPGAQILAKPFSSTPFLRQVQMLLKRETA
jgi:CheY-like chemotaxis protein